MAIREYDSAYARFGENSVELGDLTGPSKIFASFDDDTGIVIDGTVVTFVGDQSDLAAMTKAMLGDDRYDELVPVYLLIAETAIVNRLFPMDKGKTWADVPGRYGANACSIAVHLINKRGAEGEVQHEENGTKRAYTTREVPASMLADIIPFAAVPR